MLTCMIGFIVLFVGLLALSYMTFFDQLVKKEFTERQQQIALLIFIIGASIVFLRVMLLYLLTAIYGDETVFPHIFSIL